MNNVSIANISAFEVENKRTMGFYSEEPTKLVGALSDMVALAEKFSSIDYPGIQEILVALALSVAREEGI